MPKPLPSPELLRKLLRYEPDTGKLFWRERDRELFETNKSFSIWNKRNANRETGTINAHGYVLVRVSGSSYPAHRVAWAIYHGKWPKNDIDHINGNRTDNRICNLRDVTRSENMKNAKMRSDNTSGYMGISWFKARKKWHPQIKHNGKLIHLGFFDSLDEAIAARKDAEVRYGYHPNHGRNER